MHMPVPGVNVPVMNPLVATKALIQYKNAILPV